MESKPFLGPFFFFFFSHALLLTTPNKFRVTATARPIFTNETDQQALLAIKGQINKDPSHALESWNASLHFCSWQGVYCSRRHQRVTALKLVSLNLEGTLSPRIGNLSFLREIDLGNNNFQGAIPPEIGRLVRLRHLFLWNNSFEGNIPNNITHCSKLKTINLNKNHLTGEIPVKLGSLPSLIGLGLADNYLEGSIPPSLGNVSSLILLSLSENNLEGNIPDDLGSLPNLDMLQLGANKLSGMVPNRLYNISSLSFLGLALNLLHGQLPPTLGLTLPKIELIFLAANQFSGPIPKSLANASRLTILDITGNTFTVPLLLEFGTLQNLDTLKLSLNPLFTMSKGDEHLGFFRSLTNCTNLRVLETVVTNLTGVFPDSVTNLSTKLEVLRLDQNYLSGNIPNALENLVNLSYLALDGNSLSGSIPDSIGKLINLNQLRVSFNEMSGEIPPHVGNITSLNLLDLSDNMLEGTIPASLGNCRFLETLDLSFNNLTGTIPKQVAGISSRTLYLECNHLSGTLPPQVGNLKHLQAMSIAENELYGEIPSSLGDCLMLEYLYLEGNHFRGVIPSSFDRLKSMQVLDLSRNNLSGKIPQFLGNFSYLTNLNLSFNDLEGQVPDEGIFSNATLYSISGNKKLCGGIQELQLPSCPASVSSKRTKNLSLVVIVLPTVGGVISVILLATFIYRKWQSRKKIPASGLTLVTEFMDLSYRELVQATNGFSSINLLGQGSFGSVYKGALTSGMLIAVKVFNLTIQGANRSFLAECQALKSIRHRNLLKILSSCSSIDFQGNDFKALVYEFMPNGNLDSWLHPNSPTQPGNMPRLSLIQRLNIALNVADALEYLHHHCQEPVIHCDLKPSNVLLDNDLTAHVGDFGLARLLQANTTTSSHSETSSIGVRGTVGYVAPEYGMSREVSTQGDWYSYGVLLLELFTGKRPTDDIFNDSHSLHSFVQIALLNDQVMQIIDPELMPEEEENRSGITSRGGTSNKAKVKECLTSVVRIGVMCSVQSPKERLDIRDALKELHAIKKLLRS